MPENAQLEAILDYLDAASVDQMGLVRFLVYATRRSYTGGEVVDTMLPDINLLYLGTSVLLILDNSSERFAWRRGFAHGADATGFDSDASTLVATTRALSSASTPRRRARYRSWTRGSTKSAEEASSRSQTCSSRTRRIKRCSS